MKKTTVSIIIPTWNGQEHLAQCLPSLAKQTFTDFEIIVVDNGSTDQTQQFLTKHYPQVKVISLDKNYGFATAINAGVTMSKSPYVVFLNNDTVAAKNWLHLLVTTADRYPQAISVGSKLLNFYERTRLDGLAITINEIGQATSLGYNEPDHHQYDSLTYVFGVTAGAALFRRHEFIELGMLDEDYFMYFEEVDFAFRAQFAGFKSVLCPQALVYHKHKASSRKRPAHLEYWLFKNMTQTIIKDFPTSLLLKKWRLLKIILVHFNTWLYHWKHGFFWPPIAADFWILMHLPKLLSKRHQVQSSKVVPDSYIEQFLTPKKITLWGLLR